MKARLRPSSSTRPETDGQRNNQSSNPAGRARGGAGGAAAPYGHDGVEYVGDCPALQLLGNRRLDIGVDLFQYRADAGADWAFLVRLVGMEAEWCLVPEGGADVPQADGLSLSDQRPAGAGSATDDEHQTGP